MQIGQVHFLLMDLRFYLYPYFKTANKKAEIELHNPFAQVKLSVYFPICMKPVFQARPYT